MHFPFDITILAPILCSIVITYKVLYWVYWWQANEYRSDRLFTFLSTPMGHKITLNIWTTAEAFFAILGILFLVFVSPQHSSVYYLMVVFIVFLGIECIWNIRYTIVPLWTKQSIIISLTSIFSILVLLFLISIHQFNADSFDQRFIVFILSFFVILVPFIVGISVMLFRPLMSLQQQRIIAKAKEKIEHIHPIVIGITGSMGSSLTKELLYAILSNHFSVLMTNKNVNTDVELAQTIVNELQETHEIFIVEMNGDSPGQIADLCRLVSPIIGIITSISEQAVSQTTTMDVLRDTKSELLHSLPPSGVAIINRDNTLCVQAAEHIHAPKKFFSREDFAHAYATDIMINQNEVGFVLHMDNQELFTRAHVYGLHSISSILAAAIAADHLGIAFPHIVEYIQSFYPSDNPLQLISASMGSIIIDDHHNTNPEGYMAVLDYLDVFQDKRKVVITGGIHDINNQSDSVHRTIGTRIGEVADLLIITKKRFLKPLKDAAKQAGLAEEQIITCTNRREFNKKVVPLLTSQDVILVEGPQEHSLQKRILSL